MPDVVQISVEFKSVIIAIKGQGQVILQEFNNQCFNIIYSSQLIFGQISVLRFIC